LANRVFIGGRRKNMNRTDALSLRSGWFKIEFGICLGEL
jgi:hypothetical protein